MIGLIEVLFLSFSIKISFLKFNKLTTILSSLLTGARQASLSSV